MPSQNLTVSSSSTIDSKAVFLGVVCTLANQPIDDEGVFDAYHQPDEKNARNKSPYISDVASLAKLLKAEPGEVCVVKQADQDEANHILKMAIQSDPMIAEGIKMLKAQGLSYVIEVIPKHDLIKGSGDGALGVGDPEGIAIGSPLYFQARQNQASLNAIRDVDIEQHAAVTKLLSTLGNLVRISPNSPHKKRAVHFKYFLDEVSEVLSHLKETHAPTALLPCAVTAVFAKYKHKCWDAVMRLAADDAAKDLQACADVLLDAQHVHNYLKFMEDVEVTPPGPSREEFDVAFGLLSKVDEEIASAFRDLIVYLHDNVKPQVESLDKVGAVQVNDGSEDGEIESQVDQLNICIRNYLQTFYNIAQDFVEIERLSIPDKEAQLQAAMHNRIAGVSRKFWPTLESCSKNLCDATVVENIKSKAQRLTKQLTASLLRADETTIDAESTTADNSSAETYWGQIYSFLGSLLGNKDGVKEEVITKRIDEDSMSPLFSDLLEIMEQLKFYGQVASASPEESPNVPDDIQPGDHAAICGALGFVSKPKAAALFTYLKRLQSCLELVNYKSYASEKEIGSIEKFLNVDYYMMKAIQDKGHSFGVHGNVEPEGCDQMMTSVFEKYFKECWPRISAVLEGGDQEAASEKLKEMASDISNWKDPGQELDPENSRSYQNIKKSFGVNVLWYLVGMSQFFKGTAGKGKEKWPDMSQFFKRYARNEIWEWHDMTRKLWTNAICPYIVPGVMEMRRTHLRNRPWVICMPRGTKHESIDAIDLARAQTYFDEDIYDINDLRLRCLKPVEVTNSKLYLSEEGDPDWAPQTPSTGSEREDLMIYAKKHGVDLSCRRSFAFRWYDASDRVINMLCNEALHSSLSRGPLVQDPYLKNKPAKTRSLLNAYEFRLVTGDGGFELKESVPGAKYLGFLLCSGKRDMTDEQLMNRVVRHKSSKEQARAQRRCRRKPYEFTFGGLYGVAPHGVDVFYSTLKIKRNGRILIRDRRDAATLGNCWRVLEGELRASGFGLNSQQNQDVINRKQCPLNGKDPSDQCMSQEAIAKAFTEAEEKGLIGLKSYYGHPIGQGKNQFNLTTASNALHLSDGAANPATSSEALMTYWPYVLGVAGSIGAIFSAKRVWDCSKTRPNKGHRKVKESD
eukprot:Blabericola_migrator_1__2994@NODE_1868_length_3624_cov_88_885578_g465_i1_p1_GENE_NODE_1868_length_3624_cov_88_885578_g465_i1NODE_1868_length_3624_cov_88_885578_g465_i1_p1_ORF_typecomplete_len1138_score227_61Inhibitor_I34/PF10466_9/0_068PELOTA_1/PF15608_6/2_2e02PELOTA_1/PF15608_6/4_3_NODE_1868_length_3624_cov_88_885578_g465_i11493562